MVVSKAGLLWGFAMVLSNVALMPLDRTIYGTVVEFHGTRQRFQRPFFLEFVMFLAMAACLVFEIPSWYARRAERGFLPSKQICLKLMVPAVCDLLGSWFIFGGAMWIPASIVEMLVASNTVFTAILSAVFLKKTPAPHERTGVMLSIAGLTVVGIANVISGQSSAVKGDDTNENKWLPPLGLLFVIIAHFWYAVEFVVTEKLLGDHEISAFVSVGVMGLWGTLMFAVLFPLLRITPTQPTAYSPMWHEQVDDSVLVLARSPALLSAVIALFVCLSGFNAAAFKTTEHLSAMARVVLGSLTSPFVWILDLALNSIFGESAGASEQLSIWSVLQFLGFVLLLVATLIYNELVHCPCRRRTAADTDAPGVSLMEEPK